ncbi:MAG: BON domain-containing protein [Gammaproteobacteria bacterium]|nr:BON domain-containing protein [Gammaproteobacteria bacterium]
MRWTLLLLYFLLVGCVNTALSGANVVYKHKYLQEGMSDCCITIRSWNTLKHTYPEEAIKHLNLLCFNRIVLLTGQVPSAEIRSKIENTLQNIPNIAKIYNATTTDQPTTPREQLADSWITTKIKSKIITSSEIYADKIKVVTEKNIVYLVGIVTRNEAEAAVTLAEQTEGVCQIVKVFYYMTMPEIGG